MKKKIVAMLSVALAGRLWLAPRDGWASFRDRGWGVRAMGMGGAFSALSDDSSALFWNPGGSAWLKTSEASVMWDEMYPGVKDVSMASGFFSLVMPTRSGAMGAAVTSFKTAGLLQENMGLLHYSRLWGNRVSAGVNLKYLYHDYLIGSDPSASMSAVFSKGTSQSALTMDAGVLYRPFQKITLGLSGRNLTQPDVGLVSKDTVPSEYQAGVAWRPNNRLTAALDAQYRNQEYGALDDKSNVMLGLEYLFPGRFRTAGARMGVSLKEVTGGMGLQLWPQNSWSLRLDYAYALILNMANDSSGSHRVGLSFAFGKKQDAAGNAAGTK